MCIRDSVKSDDNDNGYFRFYTMGSNSLDERVRIDAGGNFRLGLDSTTIRTDSAHYGLNITGKTGTTGAGSLFFLDAADNCDANIAADDGVLMITADYSNNTANSAIKFRVDGSSEKMNISSTGKVSFIGHSDSAVYGASNYAITGSGNQSNTSQAIPEGSFQWKSDTSKGTERYKTWIQTTVANQGGMYITIQNASFYRITAKASHNSQSADVGMWLVYGLNNMAARIEEICNTGNFTVTTHNTHVNANDTTLLIDYSASTNQGCTTLIEQIGGF